MKKVIGYFVLVCLIIGIIVGFYSITGFYVWSDTAKYSKLVRKVGTFSIHNVSGVYADGEIINATNDTIVINTNEIILYCQDKNTKEIFSYPNLISYTVKKNKKITIAIHMLDPSASYQKACYIADNYQIVKIEYKLSDNEVYEIKSIGETNSYYLPLGTIIIIPILICIGIVVFTKLRKKNARITKIKAVIESQIAKFNEQLRIIKVDISNNTSSIFDQQNKLRDIERKAIAKRGGIEYVDTLTGLEFEAYCEKMFRQLNHSVTMTKGSGDCGADLIVDNTISVQCKLYSGMVGIHALYEVYGSMAKYKTKNAWVITNSHFTKQAKDYAQEAHIRLIDREQLISLIKEAYAPISSNEIIELQRKITGLQKDNANLNNQAKSIEHQIEILSADIKLLETIKTKGLQSLENKYNLNGTVAGACI